MKELQIGKNDAGQRLDRFLSKAVPLLPPSLLQKYIRLKRVKVNGKGSKRDTRLCEGDLLPRFWTWSMKMNIFCWSTSTPAKWCTQMKAAALIR